MKQMILYLGLMVLGLGSWSQNILGQYAEICENKEIIYDPSYFKIDYPNGDVPSDRGVCTDVIIRVYRKAGIDLQKQVHEDMKEHFESYPKNWGLMRPDKNIDHRRVPNLMTFFKRKGGELDLSVAYEPGDVVAWNLGGGILHIGIVSSRKSKSSDQHLILHNIGNGQVLENCLTSWNIIGHYRYYPIQE